MNKPDCIRENVILAPYTTIKLGGPARWFAEPKTADDCAAVIQWAASGKIPSIMLGGGSNIIFADAGYNGLVIHPLNTAVRWEDESCIADAGVTIQNLISEILTHNQGGLKFLVDVPGQIGGTVAGNAGGRDGWIGNFVQWAEAVDAGGEIKRWTHDECDFQYRHSIFLENNAVIIRVAFKFPAVDPNQEQTVIAQASNVKHTNQPLEALSAGCMFHNVTPPDDHRREKLVAMIGPDGTIPAWRIIAELELAGKQIGDMQVSTKHSNFLINLGHGTADQAIQLMSLIKQHARDELGVQLHDEIRILGY